MGTPEIDHPRDRPARVERDRKPVCSREVDERGLVGVAAEADDRIHDQVAPVTGIGARHDAQVRIVVRSAATVAA